MSRGAIEGISYWNILSEKDVQKLHGSALKILEKTGVKVDSEDILGMLADKGCRVDRAAHAVYMHEDFVLDALSKHPHGFVLRAVCPENDCYFKAGKSMIVTTAPGRSTVDITTWKPHMPSKQEFYDYISLINGLDYIDMHTAFPWAGFEGVPECMQLIEGFAAKLRCGHKALWEGSMVGNHRYIIQMAKAFGTEVWMNTNPTSPLTFSADCLEIMCACCENDMPFSITSGPLPGVSSPVTIAGTLALNIADILAGNAIAQTLKPGSRTIAGSLILALDMKTGGPQFANAVSFLAEAAFAQMWRYYDIPCAVNSIGWSNSKTIDYQAAYETTMAFALQAAAGATVLPFAGGLTAELTAHPLKAVIDNDVAQLVRRIIHGFQINEDTLALDLIDEMGFAPTSYLAEEHTLEYFRSERSYSSVSDMSNIAQWLDKGRPTILDHAQEKMDRILAGESRQITAEQEKAIAAVLDEAREHYRSTGAISEKEWQIYQGVM